MATALSVDVSLVARIMADGVIGLRLIGGFQGPFFSTALPYLQAADLRSGL